MYDDDAEKKWMHLFFVIWCANGVVPALIAENMNLLAYPIGLIPFFVIVHLASADHAGWPPLVVAAGATLVAGVLGVTFPQVNW